MQYPVSLNFNPHNSNLNRWLISLFIFDVILLLFIGLTLNVSNMPVKFIAFSVFGLLLLLTLMTLFRLFMAKQTGKWLKISKNGLRDHSSLLGLGRIPVEDIRSLKVVNIYGSKFLRARISLQSDCFHDLDEPKGLIVDVYNLFFKGKVLWPLALVDIDENKLKEYLAYYNQYIKQLKVEQTIKPGKALKVRREKPLLESVEPSDNEVDTNAAIEVEINDPPPAPEEASALNIDEVTSIELDADSRVLPIENETQSVAMTGFDKTLHVHTNIDNLGFARKLCDAYVEGLRWLPKVKDQTQIHSELTSIKLEKPSDSLEVLSFDYKGQSWKLSVERQNEALMAYVRIFIDDELKFEVDTAVELGSLEPTRLLQDSEGPWKQQALELFENLQQNKSFSI